MLFILMPYRPVVGGENLELIFDPLVLGERRDGFCFG